MKHTEAVMCRINIDKHFSRDTQGKTQTQMYRELSKERDNCPVGWDAICCPEEKPHSGREVLKNRTKSEGEMLTKACVYIGNSGTENLCSGMGKPGKLLKGEAEDIFRVW